MSISLSLSLSLLPFALRLLSVSSTFCLLIADPPGQSRVLADVSNASIVRSSHSASAAIVADYLKLADRKRSAIATQGDIEAAIYSCQCRKNIHYWHTPTPCSCFFRKASTRKSTRIN